MILIHRVLRWLLFLWVKVEVFPREDLPFEPDPSVPTLYVLADRGLSDLLVLTHTTRNLGLPGPLQRIEPAGVERHYHSVYSIASRSPLTDWIRQRRKQSRLLEDFLSALRQGDLRRLQVVPVSVYWGRPLAKQKHWLQVLFSDTWALAGRTRRFFTLLIHGRNASLLFSKPLSFEALAIDCDYSAERLHDQLLEQLSRQREATFGPRVDRRASLTNAVLQSPEVQQVLDTVAAEENSSQAAAMKQARKYCREIFADCTQLTIELMLRLLRTFWRRFYSGIDIYDFEPVKELALTHQLVYVPCHRSHVDYLLLSYVIFTENLAIPYIAAGNNLDMPVIGRILRGGGAFFIRRSFRDNPLYGAVMRAYVEQLVRMGVPLEYFIEAGRSRSGRLLKPKLGMLDMTVEAYIKTRQRPLAFVPVYIGYDKLIEGQSYLGELYGEKKKKESFLGAIRAIGQLRGNFGRVTCRFGTPIELEKLLAEHCEEWPRKYRGQETKPDWYRNAVESLSQRIMVEINHASVINPVNMVATILLATPRQSIDLAELISQAALFRDLVKSINVFAGIRLFEEPISPELIERLARQKLLHIRRHELGDIVYLKHEDAVLMSYYRNNSLHAFIVPALIACSFSNRTKMTPEKMTRTCGLLYPFLKSELHLEWTQSQLTEIVESCTVAMVSQGLLYADESGLRRPGRSSRHFIDLKRLAQIIQPVLERYYMTFIVLWQSAKSPMKEDELEQRCHLFAQKVSMLHGINSPDFFDRLLFRHFIETMIERGYLQKEDNGRLLFSEQLDAIDLDTRNLLSIEVRASILSMIKPDADSRAS